MYALSVQMIAMKITKKQNCTHVIQFAHVRMERDFRKSEFTAKIASDAFNIIKLYVASENETVKHVYIDKY